ncbi:MAG TPA: diguanylate cyclase DgcA [Clostridia bacterium]|nr:diguanylate cyclase DgcA [Clostridia bacterium]
MDADTADRLEKEVFDLRQLLEISKSLSSNLDYYSLLDSIIYICMGQMGVTQAAIFSRDNLEIPGLKMMRNLEGFSLDSSRSYIISTESTLGTNLIAKPVCYTLEELSELVDDPQSLETLQSLSPTLIVPLVAGQQLMGLIVLGERIHADTYSKEDKHYLLDIAHFASIAIHNAVLFEMSTTDIMTRLKLRHYFFTILAKRIQHLGNSNTKLSVIMGDIDFFKHVNDTYGHQTGDEVIISISSIIRDNLRTNDIGARYGGEEFIVLLYNTDEKQAYEIAERLRMKVSKTNYEDAGCKDVVHISLGVVEYNPRIDCSAQDIIRRVDKALYYSKEKGRNRTTTGSSLQSRRHQ